MTEAILQQEVIEHTSEISKDAIEETFKLLESKSQQQLNFFWLGRQDFDSVWKLQKMIHRAVSKNECAEMVLFVEHDHVYTFGKNANQDHLLPSYPSNAKVIQIDRGGDVTYHGPGQLVMYPIIDLHNYRLSISWYMHTLERTIIDVLLELGIESERKEGLIGVWVEDEKICAMGVRLAKWISMHGLALNVNPMMDYFNGMIPCGIFEYGVTSIHELTGNDYSLSDIVPLVANKFVTLLDQVQKSGGMD